MSELITDEAIRYPCGVLNEWQSWRGRQAEHEGEHVPTSVRTPGPTQHN